MEVEEDPPEPPPFPAAPPRTEPSAFERDLIRGEIVRMVNQLRTDGVRQGSRYVMPLADLELLLGPLPREFGRLGLDRRVLLRRAAAFGSRHNVGLAGPDAYLDEPVPAAPPEDNEGFAALYGPVIQEALDAIRDELRNRGRQDGVRWKMPVANLRTRLDPGLVRHGFTVRGMLRHAARLGRPRMGLEGDEAYYEEPAAPAAPAAPAPAAPAPSATSRGDQGELLQAFQDYLTADGSFDIQDKTRLRFLLLIPGTGSIFVPLQARYRSWLGPLATAHQNQQWANQVMDRMLFSGEGLERPRMYTAPQYRGEYTVAALARTMRKFVDFLQSNPDLRRRLFR